MVIYEVKVNVDEDVYNEYLLWLNEHAQLMLTNPGFKEAKICEDDSGSITVYYYVDTHEDLEHYFRTRAQKMRDAANGQFAGKFTATRSTHHVAKCLP